MPKSLDATSDTASVNSSVQNAVVTTKNSNKDASKKARKEKRASKESFSMLRAQEILINQVCLFCQTKCIWNFVYVYRIHSYVQTIDIESLRYTAHTDIFIF